MPDWIFAVLFNAAFPIYKFSHQKRAYGRTEKHLQNAANYIASTVESSQLQETFDHKTLLQTTAKDVFRGIYWNALDSYRGLARLPRITRKIVFENEKILLDAIARSTTPDGAPRPIAAISIHQGAFELLHRSLCLFSDNVHLITDSVGDKATRQLLKDLRSDAHLTEYHPDELSSLLRNLFTHPSKLGKKDCAILAMVIDQGKNTKGNKVSLFGHASTLYMRLPEKINQMGAGIVTFRTYTTRTKIVIRFETFYPPKFNQQNNQTDFNKNCSSSLTECIAREVEFWISEHPSEWCWNYHGNFRT